MTDRLLELLELSSTFLLDVDGAGRALVSNDEPGVMQLFEVDPDGTRCRLTTTDEPCSGRYLPGTRQVVVSTDSGGSERAQLWLLAADAPGDPWVPLANDPDFIHALQDVGDGVVVYSTNRRNGVDFDVVIHQVATGEERVVWDRGGWIQGATLSPDANRLAMVRLSLLPASTELLLADLTTGSVASITDPEMPGEWSAPAWLGRDTLLATSDSGAEYRSVRSFDVASGSWRVLLVGDDTDVAGRPSPDGCWLAVLTRDDGVDTLAMHRIAHDEIGDAQAIPLPDSGVLDFRQPPVWAADSRILGLTFESPTRTPEAYTWSAEAGLARRTHSNGADVSHGLVSPTSHRVPTPDGEQVPAFVYDGGDAAGSGVLVIHGGPEAAALRSWNPVVAGLALAGHIVVVPNVRGSAGYGRRWVSLDDIDKRLDSVADLAALHAWLPEIGVDPGRAALYGGSYGGYLVLAGLAFQPDLWAAGVDIVGISSLVTFLRNTSAYRRAYREKEYGHLDTDLEFLESASPINRIGDVRSPLFVIHGANDPRVPLSEAEQIVAALRSRDVACELLVYPDEGHGLAKRANRLDAYPKAFAFLARHLGRGSAETD